MSKLKLLAEYALCKTAVTLLDVATGALEMVSPSKNVDYGDNDANDLINGSGGFAVEGFRCNKNNVKPFAQSDVTKSAAYAHLKN